MNLSWQHVHSPAYPQIVALRRLAYGLVGRIDAASGHDAMQDAFDERSQILTAWSGGEVVGSLRITPHVHGTPNEYSPFYAFPEGFPPPRRTFVLTRICTHPDHRGRGLIFELIAEAFRRIRTLGGRYVLGGCTDGLVPLYERVGLRKYGMRSARTDLNGVCEELLFGDLADGERTIAPALWARYFHAVFDS